MADDLYSSIVLESQCNIINMTTWVGNLRIICEGHHLQVDCLLALYVEHRLCIDLYVSRANFLTTLRSHLGVTFSSYFWSILFNVDINYLG